MFISAESVDPRHACVKSTWPPEVLLDPHPSVLPRWSILICITLLWITLHLHRKNFLGADKNNSARYASSFKGGAIKRRGWTQHPLGSTYKKFPPHPEAVGSTSTKSTGMHRWQMKFIIWIGLLFCNKRASVPGGVGARLITECEGHSGGYSSDYRLNWRTSPVIRRPQPQIVRIIHHPCSN